MNKEKWEKKFDEKIIDLVEWIPVERGVTFDYSKLKSFISHQIKEAYKRGIIAGKIKK